MTPSAFLTKGTAIHNRFTLKHGDAPIGITAHLSTNEHVSDNSSAHPEKSEKAGSLKTKDSIQSISIILADDDRDDRDLFREAVESDLLNIRLEFAEDGKSLSDMLLEENRIPDILFLDLNMPYKSGMECLVEIRKTERLINLPVIIYSTSSSHKDIENAFQNGANLYIRKPSSFQELQRLISNVLLLDWDFYQPHTSRQHFLFHPK